MSGLDATVTGWTPDVGHIRNGGMDILSKMAEFRPLINHIHYKDWDGNPDRVIMEGGNALQLGDQAKKEGVADLRESGLNKVRAGLTSLAEVNRVTVD